MDTAWTQQVGNSSAFWQHTLSQLALLFLLLNRENFLWPPHLWSWEISPGGDFSCCLKTCSLSSPLYLEGSHSFISLKAYHAVAAKHIGMIWHQMTSAKRCHCLLGLTSFVKISFEWLSDWIHSTCWYSNWTDFFCNVLSRHKGIHGYTNFESCINSQ